MGLTEKKLFFRETGSQEFKSLEVEIKKTSIDEFNQVFWDSTLYKIPKKNTWYFELIGNLNGDYNDKNQKLELIRALELQDKEKTAIFENIEKLFDTILKQNVKSNSFFKVRSGIIGGKVEANEINDISKDTLTSKQKLQKEKEAFLKWRKRVLSNLVSSLFDEEKLDLAILKKASKYTFTQTDFTYLGDTPVYIINFNPNGNADYKGKIYVDAEKLALIRIEYKNIILHDATWRFKKEDIATLLDSQNNNDDFKQKIAEFRENFKLPKFILLSESDNELLVNLDNLTSVRMLLGAVKKRSRFTVTEFLFGDNGWVKKENEYYTNQIIVAFYNDEKRRRENDIK